jgi:hypothetical protein
MARNILLFNDFVNDYHLGRTEEDLDKYTNEQQVRVAAMRTFRDLQLDSFRTISTIRLPVNTSLWTVELPSDYVRYTKIGVLGDDCTVHTITLDTSMNISGDILLDNDDNELLDVNGFPLSSARITSCSSTDTNEVDNAGYLFSNYNYNGYYGRLFGYGGGNNINGYYRFNTEENRIDLSINFPHTEIILEYISDQSLSDDPKIPVECEKAMYSGTYYFLINRMGNPVGQGDKEQARREYLNDKRMAKSRRLQPTKNEIVSSIYKQYTLAPRITS